MFERLVDPVQLDGMQLSLFTPAIDDLLEELGVRQDEIDRLFQAGLLSFEPEGKERLSDSEAEELRLLGVMLRGGCDVSAIRSLTRTLARPYAYDSRRMVFSFEKGCWLERRTATTEELANTVIRNVHHLDVDLCAELATAAIQRLAALAEAASDDEEE